GHGPFSASRSEFCLGSSLDTTLPFLVDPSSCRRATPSPHNRLTWSMVPQLQQAFHRGHRGELPMLGRPCPAPRRDVPGAWQTAHVATSTATDTSTEFIAALRSSLVCEVDTGTRRRAEYSTDASNYRVVPEVVVFPRSNEDVTTALELARRYDVPVTARGGGTWIAGSSVGTGMVLEFASHLNLILESDTESRTAGVQTGVVMSDLPKAAAEYGLRFGLDPSSQARATMGALVGNNA